MYSLGKLRADLTTRVGLSADPTQVQGWQDAAIREMIDSTWWRVVDYAYSDLVVDGTNRRWYLYGDNIAVLPPIYQTIPDGLASPPFYLPFSSIDWRQNAPDDLVIEQALNNAGMPPSPPVDLFSLDAFAGGSDIDYWGVGAIVANTVPQPVRAANGSALTTYIRVWYQRRCPQPDYSKPDDYIRVPPQFARIASLGYYLGVLSDNQAGGDLRLWRKRADEYLQQAQLIYAQAVPVVSTFNQKADDWLVTGVPG